MDEHIIDKSKYEVISKYGVTLTRLKREDIEMLRCWRNDPKISQYMGTHQHITSEAQIKWFEETDKRNDIFNFIVSYKGEKIGFVCIKNVDYVKKTGEPGVFIYHEEKLNPIIPYYISFISGHFYFDILKLEYLTIHIVNTNKRAIRFNKSLGAILQNGQNSMKNQLYYSCKNDFNEKMKNILNYIE